jgi:mannan endo-1,6-alpha-mannosidase
MKDICEQYNACDVDQHSFKAYLARWMAATTQMAPFTFDQVLGLLTSSAKAAAAQCNGAPTGQVCGLKWYLNGTWDGTSGVGQQMAAMEVILGTLIKQTQAPLTNTTGGTSLSNPTAGYNASSVPPGAVITPATKADKVGAWLLTAIIILATVWACWFLWSPAWEPRAPVTRPVTMVEAKVRDRESTIIQLNRPKSVAVLVRIDEDPHGQPRYPVGKSFT